VSPQEVVRMKRAMLEEIGILQIVRDPSVT
jgi:hypothetical protein